MAGCLLNMCEAWVLFLTSGSRSRDRWLANLTPRQQIKQKWLAIIRLDDQFKGLEYMWVRTHVPCACSVCIVWFCNIEASGSCHYYLPEKVVSLIEKKPTGTFLSFSLNSLISISDRNALHSRCFHQCTHVAKTNLCICHYAGHFFLCSFLRGRHVMPYFFSFR